MPKQAEKAIKLKLNGKPLVLKESSPRLDAFIAFLEKLPDDELFDLNGLEDAKLYKIDQVRHLVHRNRERMAPYYVEVGTKRRWHFGNARAVRALKKQIEREATPGGAI